MAKRKDRRPGKEGARRPARGGPGATGRERSRSDGRVRTRGGGRTADTRARTAARPRRGTPQRRLPAGLPVVALVVAVAVAVVLAGVWLFSPGGAERRGGGGSGEAMEHVHGLGVNPADGALYAGTHAGVFRVADGSARRVGDSTQDMMGFTVVGADHFLASGHPGEEGGDHPHLGLVESTDGGETWKPLSLEGEADFHALRFRHGMVYGYNSVSGQFLVSEDKVSWQRRSQVPLRDFAVSPSDPQTVVASGERGVMRSSDGGRTWNAGDATPLVLEWEAQDRLWGVTAEGRVIRSTDGGASWSDAGDLDEPAVALAVHDGTLYAATADARILRSTDEGGTWDGFYTP